MKPVAREGLWFAVPIGDGRQIDGLVTAVRSRRCAATFFDSAGTQLWSGWLFDRALSHHRWPVVAARAWDAEPPASENQPLEPRAVERLLATLLGGSEHPRGRLRVRDLRPPIDWRALDELEDGTRLQWRHRLDDAGLASAERWLDARPNASVRLYGAAAPRVAAMAEWSSVRRLSLDATALPPQMPAMPHVAELELDGAEELELLAAFPNLTSLRIMTRAPVDGGIFAALPRLERLTLIDLDLRDADAVFRIATLQALALLRVRGVRSLAALKNHENLRTLALDGLLDVNDLRPLGTIPHLDSLDIRAMWQFGTDDVAFVTEMPALHRLHLDIGGRRKNVETYKRRAFAHPLPL